MSVGSDGYISGRSVVKGVNTPGVELAGGRQARRGPRPVEPGVVGVALVVVAAALLRPLLVELLDRPAVAHWATIFVAIAVQALPFLVLGVVISAAVAALVPAGLLPRLLPARPALAVPMAAAAGVALPGCECGSVPIARRLVDRGAPPSAALAFLLSAPAVNPVVLTATAVAFPGRPQVVLARLLASLLTATVVGLLWARRGRDDLLARVRRRPVPEGPPLAVLAAPAVAMALCSEADAFVAASLTQFSLGARLAFLVVGPMVDVKLISLQAGTFGRGFALRFAPLTLAVALVSSAVVAWWLL